MYQVSDKTNEYLLGNNRMFQARISAGDKEIISGFISIKQYQQSNGSNYISIGDAVSSNVEIKLWKPEEDIDFENIKTKANEVISSFSEENLSYYDLQFFIESANEESEIYPQIGYKFKANEEFAW